VRRCAHLVNANVETLLFELPQGRRSEWQCEQALDGLKKLEPSPIASPAKVTYIQAANYDQHLERLRECDW